MFAAALIVSPAIGFFLSDLPSCPHRIPKSACFGAEWKPEVKLPLNDTIDYVRKLLQEAVKVEHGTIPLYLTSLYSIDNLTGFEASTVRSVVMEEMLHMVNAANVLNAIGGAPLIDHPSFVPKYPLVLPLINVSASITWFSQESIKHYHILESIPQGGFNTSISAAYLHIVTSLTALCDQHGEAAVFSGDPGLQVEARTTEGQIAPKVFSLQNATTVLLGVADQGGGCPIDGSPWPEFSNISAGRLGGEFSHAARFVEILKGQKFRDSDNESHPTGEILNISWNSARRFTPNPTVSDFAPEQCVEGGSWVVRNSSFFVSTLWIEHGKQLWEQVTDTWQECASLCQAWTINKNEGLEPCAMWSWQSDSAYATPDVPAHTCLLGQQFVPPSTAKVEGFVSGCQYGTVCNNSIPLYDEPLRHLSRLPTSPTLAKECAEVHQRALDFAGNYTAFLVSLHNVFNGQPGTLMGTLGQMYALKAMAVALMQTDDPRIPNSTLGIGPPWEYIPAASHYQTRRGKAR